MPMHNSIQLSQTCEFIDINKINPLISQCKIKVCYVGEQPNRNGTVITKDVAKELAQSLPGSPIVGYFNEETQDFEEHNKTITIKNNKISFSEDTKPYGFVDIGAKCWFQPFLDDGVEHEYLVTEGYLWTGQFPEAKRVIEKGNNQSMELDMVKGDWSKTVNSDGEFFIINEAIISKLCILGEDYEPCFEGASVTNNLQFSFDDNFNQQIYSMMGAIANYLKKGGDTMDNEEIQLQEEEVQEEVIEEADVVEEDPVLDETEEQEGTETETEEVEDEVEEDKPVDESDEDEVEEDAGPDIAAEFAALQERYNALQEAKDELDSLNARLNEQIKQLTTFKVNVERKDKEQMIKSFYMLSDADKKDVIDNIDTYSIDEIEAKLSVICFRNKINFGEDETPDEGENFSFNLDSVEDDSSNYPAWIQETMKHNK